MAKAKKAKLTKKIKKKFWFNIIAPQEFKGVKLGQIYLTHPEKCIGREMKYNLREITRNSKDQFITLNLLLTKVSGQTINAELMGYKMVPSFIRRMSRKKTEKVEDSYLLETKDKIPIRIKTTIITRGNTTKSVCSHIRKLAKEHVTKYAEKNPFVQFVQAATKKMVSIELKRKLAKTFPIKTVEIREIQRQDKKEIKKNLRLEVKEIMKEKKQKRKEEARKEEEEKVAAKK